MERWIRWLIVLPLALISAAIVQIGSNAVAQSALSVIFGFPDWLGPVSRSLASMLMGASFVVSVWWLVPTDKTRFAALSVFVLVVWGGRLTLTAIFTDGSPWSSVIGLAGVVGGIATFLLVRGHGSFQPSIERGGSWRSGFTQNDG